jgi:CheY-like chemotaxis protein
VGAIAGDAAWGFDPAALNHIADEVLQLHQAGIQVGVMVGGGNIFKGELGETWGIERAEADNIGMMATVINSLLLRGVLQARGQAEVRVMTALPINTVAEPFLRLRALRHLEHHAIVVLAAGTGNPYVTTDYPAVQRALELRADALLSAKNGIDGWQFHRLQLRTPHLATISVLIMSAVAPALAPLAWFQAVGYLKKPFTVDEVLAHLAPLCHRRVPPPPPHAPGSVWA